MNDHPLTIAFAPGTTITKDTEVSSQLPIVQNGPPGTRVVFPDGKMVPLPTDQIVTSSDTSGAAVVAFGGMEYSGFFNSRLQFRRVHDVLPGETLSPERGKVMTLDPAMVSSIYSYGELIWRTGTVH